jgi:ribose 1,5-bisphosphokinase
MTAPLIYVMGPSGAGKDSVLERARAMIPPDVPVAFAHRYITRPANVGGENHVALARTEFALRRAHGLFAFHWHAHGNDYGIGHEIQGWRAAGLTVVVSGSREHYEKKVAGDDPDLHPVLITAAPDTLKSRLTARGRESTESVANRLERSAAFSVNDPRLLTIVNDGTLDAAAEAFVKSIARLHSLRDGRRRA